MSNISKSSKRKKYNPKKSKLNEIRLAQTQLQMRGIYLASVLLPLENENGQRVQDSLIAHLDLFSLQNQKIQYLAPNNYLTQAIELIRHNWTLGVKILCRNKSGKLYFVQEYEYLMKSEEDISNLNELINQKLIEHWNKANPDYRLAICYGLAPYNCEFTPYHLLAPVFYREALNCWKTKYEQIRKNIPYFDIDNYDAFYSWFCNQKSQPLNAVSQHTFCLAETNEEIENVSVLALYPKLVFAPEKANIKGIKTLGTVCTKQQLEVAIKIYNHTQQ